MLLNDCMSFTCPICNSNEYSLELSAKDFTVSKESFDVVSCKNCGLWQTFPFPDKNIIGRYYESKEYISHSDTKETLFDKIYHFVRNITIKQKTNLVKKYVPRGTILDFGCGTGYFLENCKKTGFNTYGIEPNDNARNLAIQKGLEVKSDISYFVDNNISFDVITLWHVLEHLYNPKEFINLAYELLNDKKYLIIAVPNRLSYDAKFYKEFWAGYDVPRHLFHFTQNDIKNLIKDKFVLKQINPMYFDSFYVSILSEKYKGNRYSFISGMLRGCLSNASALFTNQYSSLIYVLQKM